MAGFFQPPDDDYDDESVSDGSGSRGSGGSDGDGGSGSRGSGGSDGGSHDDDEGDDDGGGDGTSVTKIKFFYTTPDDDGSPKWVDIALPEGTSPEDVPLEDSYDQALAQLDADGTEVASIEQVTLEVDQTSEPDLYFDYDLVEDDDGALSLEPKSESDDLLATLSTGDADEDDAPADDDADDDDADYDMV